MYNIRMPVNRKADQKSLSTKKCLSNNCNNDKLCTHCNKVESLNRSIPMKTKVCGDQSPSTKSYKILNRNPLQKKDFVEPTAVSPIIAEDVRTRSSQVGRGTHSTCKHKGNLTTSSHLPTSVPLPNKCSQQNSRESLDEGTTCLSNQRREKNEKINNIVERTVSMEMSRMFDLTNSYQKEILLIEGELKGDTQLKLLKRQAVFVKWINELTESNMYLLNLMNSQNKKYEKEIDQHKQAIKHITAGAENCREDSINFQFEADGEIDQNKYMQKLIQTLQDNLKHRENEITTLEILKETCNKNKSSILDVLVKLRDDKKVNWGEEFVPFFKSKSKFLINDGENIQKELDTLRKEKQEMEIILMNKTGEIRKLKSTIGKPKLNEAESELSCSKQVQEAQTLISFDKDLKLEGHEDLFLFKQLKLQQ